MCVDGWWKPRQVFVCVVAMPLLVSVPFFISFDYTLFFPRLYLMWVCIRNRNKDFNAVNFRILSTIGYITMNFKLLFFCSTDDVCNHRSWEYLTCLSDTKAFRFAWLNRPIWCLYIKFFIFIFSTLCCTCTYSDVRIVFSWELEKIHAIVMFAYVCRLNHISMWMCDVRVSVSPCCRKEREWAKKGTCIELKLCKQSASAQSVDREEKREIC